MSSSRVLTSRDAELRRNGVAIAKARDVSLVLATDTNDDSGLGQNLRTFVYGMATFNGSCLLQYDSSANVSAILQDRLNNVDTEDDFYLWLIDRKIGGKALFPSVGISVTVGGIVEVPVSLVFNTMEGTV